MGEPREKMPSQGHKDGNEEDLSAQGDPGYQSELEEICHSGGNTVIVL